jgi:hypothetical protein
MFKFLVLWIGTLLIFMAPASHASAPQVVVTIKPIHEWGYGWRGLSLFIIAWWGIATCL